MRDMPGNFGKLGSVKAIIKVIQLRAIAGCLYLRRFLCSLCFLLSRGMSLSGSRRSSLLCSTGGAFVVGCVTMIIPLFLSVKNN